MDRTSPRASVTLVALCFTAVLAIALTSYIALCSRSYSLSTRTLNEDKARQLALVGLEEALWALNQNIWTGSGPANADVWGTSGANRTASLTYSALGQGASGALALTVANFASTGPTWPTITSVATVTLADGRIITKTLQASTGPAPLFGNALASADSYVSFVQGGTVDSWNSDPDNNPATAAVAYSFTAGNAANYAAVIAATDTDGDLGSTYSVVLNQALVNGYVATAGKSVSYSTSGTPPGKVKGPATPAGTNVDTARLGKSAFIPTSSVFTVNVPSAPAANKFGLLSALTSLLNALLGTMPSGTEVYEYTTDLTINGAPLFLGGLASPNWVIEHPVTIIVDGDLTVGTLLIFRGKITVKPTGSLQLFVKGDLTIGADGIDNQTNDPRKVAIFCTDTSTSDSVQYTTPEDFCGVIYSESKPIDIRASATIYGALLSNQYVRFSGGAVNPTVHYDTSLRNVRFSNISTPYVITQMSEP
jgi:hypothetical protein